MDACLTFLEIWFVKKRNVNHLCEIKCIPVYVGLVTHKYWWYVYSMFLYMTIDVLKQLTINWFTQQTRSQVPVHEVQLQIQRYCFTGEGQKR